MEYNQVVDLCSYSTHDFWGYLMAALCIIIIVVNFPIVISSELLLHWGQEPRNTYIFLGNICLSDMIRGVVTLFLLFYPDQLHNEIACSISISLDTTVAMVSVFSIGLIGIDRYLYILYGLHYQRYITTKRPRWIVFSIWFVGGLLGFMPVLGLRNPMEGKVCWFTLLVPPKVVLLLASVRLVPMVLVFVLYGIILKKALNSISRLNSAAISSRGRNLQLSRGRAKTSRKMSTIYEEDDGSSRIRSFGFPCCRRNNCSLEISPLFCESKWKAIKVVGFTTGAFFITWFPYYVTCVFHAFCDNRMQPEHCMNLQLILGNPLAVLSLSNSLLNPIIYAWWHNGFRESVKRMYRKLWAERCQGKSAGRNVKQKIYHTFSIKGTEPENFDKKQRF